LGQGLKQGRELTERNSNSEVTKWPALTHRILQVEDKVAGCDVADTVFGCNSRDLARNSRGSGQNVDDSRAPTAGLVLVQLTNNSTTKLFTRAMLCSLALMEHQGWARHFDVRLNTPCSLVRAAEHLAQTQWDQLSQNSRGRAL